MVLSAEDMYMVAGVEHARIGLVVVPLKLLILIWNVDPQRSLSANGAGALNREANGIYRLGRWW